MHYKNLIVWQKSMTLVVEVYKITKLFPKEETYGLVSQMRRAAISIPSNLAEGSRRSSRKDYRNFILIAYGSASELETQLDISHRLQLVIPEALTVARTLLEEVLRMLNKLCDEIKE